MLYMSNLIHNTIVHSIVCRRFNLSFLTFFGAIFPNANPLKHGVNIEINS